jgi:hypothetical protein
MEWGYGRILGGVGACSADMPDLSWEMGLGSDFGMCGAESYLSKKRFRSYMALPARRMHLLHMDYSSSSLQ